MSAANAPDPSTKAEKATPIQHTGFGQMSFLALPAKGKLSFTTLCEQPVLGNVDASRVPEIAGLPCVGFYNGAPVRHTLITGRVNKLSAGGLFRAIGTVGCGDGRLNRLSSHAMSWLATCFYVETTPDPVIRGLWGSSRSKHGQEFVIPDRVAAAAFPQAGSKRSYLSASIGGSWDPYDNTAKKPSSHKCKSMLHDPLLAGVPSVHGALVFGKAMCEACFQQSCEQTGSDTDHKTVKRQLIASQAVATALSRGSPRFKQTISPLMKKYRHWIGVGMLNPNHYEPPRLSSQDGNVACMRAACKHAAAIVDYPLLFNGVYRSLPRALSVTPKLPTLAIHRWMLASTHMASLAAFHGELAATGRFENRCETGTVRSKSMWVPKTRTDTATTVWMRWKEEAIVDPRIGIIIISLSSTSECVVTRAYARVWAAILSGELKLHMVLVPDLPPDTWVGLPNGSLKHSCDVVFDLKVRGTLHDHRAVYTNAHLVSWEKLAWFLKCHVDLQHRNSVPAEPLSLTLAGSLTRAVVRTVTSYGPTTVVAGCAWEELAHVALGTVSPEGLTCEHGACCDPLGYDVDSSPEVQWAVAALAMEKRLLKADAAVIGRFEEPVAGLCARFGVIATSERFTHGPPCADLFARLKSMQFVNECGNGNFGFDSRTRELANARATF